MKFQKGHRVNNGRIASEETRIKMSLAKKGRIGKKPSEETKRKMSEARKRLFSNGYVHPNLGKKASQELLKKLSDSHKGQIPWCMGTKGLVRAWNYLDGRSKHKTYRKHHKGIPMSHIVWCRENQLHRVPTDCVIHHIDLNPLNNKTENLQLLEDRYHRSMHNQLYKLMKRGDIDISI